MNGGYRMSVVVEEVTEATDGPVMVTGSYMFFKKDPESDLNYFSE